jgi:hypothetical protein
VAVGHLDQDDQVLELVGLEELDHHAVGVHDGELHHPVQVGDDHVHLGGQVLPVLDLVVGDGISKSDFVKLTSIFHLHPDPGEPEHDQQALLVLVQHRLPDQLRQELDGGDEQSSWSRARTTRT